MSESALHGGVFLAGTYILRVGDGGRRGRHICGMYGVAVGIVEVGLAEEADEDEAEVVWKFEEGREKS